MILCSAQLCLIHGLAIDLTQAALRSRAQPDNPAEESQKMCLIT